MLTLAGATARGRSRLRLLLAAWVVLSLGATYGVPPFLGLFHLLLMTRLVALYSYLDGSWLFAMSVLAELAVDDIRLGARGGAPARHQAVRNRPRLADPRPARVERRGVV